MSTKSKLPTTIKKTGEVDVIMCMVRTDSLKPAPFNPPGRTQLKELTSLIESMRQNGFKPTKPIQVAFENSMIIDGHRRHAVALYLQMKEVPIILEDGDPDELWALYNGTTMTVTGKQIMQARARGLVAQPPKFAQLMSRLEAVVGDEGMIELGKRPGGTSPYIINQAGTIAKYCGHEGEVDFLRSTVFWLADHARMNTLTQAAIRENADAGEIERAIKRNQPLKRSYGA